MIILPAPGSQSFFLPLCCLYSLEFQTCRLYSHQSSSWSHSMGEGASLAPQQNQLPLFQLDTFCYKDAWAGKSFLRIIQWQEAARYIDTNIPTANKQRLKRIAFVRGGHSRRLRAHKVNRLLTPRTIIHQCNQVLGGDEQRGLVFFQNMMTCLKISFHQGSPLFTSSKSSRWNEGNQSKSTCLNSFRILMQKVIIPNQNQWNRPIRPIEAKAGATFTTCNSPNLTLNIWLVELIEWKAQIDVYSLE